MERRYFCKIFVLIRIPGDGTVAMNHQEKSMLDFLGLTNGVVFFVKVLLRKIKSWISRSWIGASATYYEVSFFRVSIIFELVWLKWSEGWLLQSENWLTWLYNLLFLESLPLYSLSCTSLMWKCVIAVQHLEGETEVTLKSAFTVRSFYHLQANLLQ